MPPVTEADTVAAQPVATALREQTDRLLRYSPTLAIADLWLRGFREGTSGTFPGFDPLDALPHLSYLYLLEREGDLLRYRVSGEAVNDLFGSNHTGKTLDQVVPAGIYGVINPYFHDVFESKACVFKGHVVHPGPSHTEFERLLLPVRRNGVLQLLGILALSTTAALRTDDRLPPRADSGFHFTQIDLNDGTVTEARIPLAELPLEEMPFESHMRARPRPLATLKASQKDFETIY